MTSLYYATSVMTAAQWKQLVEICQSHQILELRVFASKWECEQTPCFAKVFVIY